MPSKIDKLEYAIDIPISSSSVSINTDNINNTIKVFKEKESIILSPADFILHVFSKYLRSYISFNSFFDEHNSKIVQNSEINIGYSINVGKGPRIGVLCNTDSMNLRDLSYKIKQLALEYIHEDFKNFGIEKSTTVVTNLSSFESLHVITPIYKNQGALLSISSEYDSVKILGGELVPNRQINITLSFDSRLSDCLKCLEFLNRIKNSLENDDFLIHE